MVHHVVPSTGYSNVSYNLLSVNICNLRPSGCQHLALTTFWLSTRVERTTFWPSTSGGYDLLAVSLCTYVKKQNLLFLSHYKA